MRNNFEDKRDLGQSEYVVTNKRWIPWILKLFLPYSPLLLLSIALALIINAATLLKPYIIKIVIDTHLTEMSGNIKAITTLAFFYILVVACSSLTQYVQDNIIARIGQKTIHKIRVDLFKQIESLSLSFFDKNSVGRILTRITSDVEAISDLFSSVFITLFSNILMIAGIIVTMFAINYKLAIVSMFVVPLVIFVAVLYRVLMVKNFRKVKAALARLNAFLAENIMGMRIIQLFGREKEKFKQFDKVSSAYYKLGLREVMLHGFSQPVMQMIANIATAVLIFTFAPDVFTGALEIGVLYAFTNYIRQFFEPISSFVEQYTAIQSAFISAERIHSIMEIKDQIEDYKSGTISSGNIKGDIEFKNVSFSYDGESEVMKDVSFKINAGQKVAFVGTTGAGKTTIISLLTRFYDIDSGEILLDGHNIKDYKLTYLRKQIGVVMQEPFLFEGNITDNISLENPNIDRLTIENAAKIVSADEFINTLENGYESYVSERGRTFSSGQRQLISFARAVASNPSVLILDEATANIDTSTEQLIQKAMSSSSKGRTSIIIAHRLSTITDSDIIFVLQSGKIAQQGNHNTLMEQGGIYFNLYSHSVREND